MKQYILQPERKIEVCEDVDVLVVGGGPGGFPSAIAAARAGMSVMLVESYGFLGGLATSGLMGPIFGYAPTAEEKEHKPFLGGIPIELISRLQKIGAAPSDDKIDWSAIRFDPELMKHVMDWMIQEAGVKVLFHSWASDVIMDGNRIDCVIIENKSGHMAIRAKIVIDATGDGDIAVMAGEDYTKGRKADGLTQSFGTKFIIGGVGDDAPNLNSGGEINGGNTSKPEESGDFGKLRMSQEARARVIEGIRNHEINCYQLVLGEVSEQGVTLREGERTPTITRMKGDGTNVYDLTNGEIQLRKDSYDIVEFYKKNIAGYENAYLVRTPTQVGVRETRQIKGLTMLTKEDVLERRKHPDTAVARGCWFFDIHCPRGQCSPHIECNGMCSMQCAVEPTCYMKTKFADQMLDEPYWSIQTDYYDIPYGCMVPLKTQNLFVSGRAICADHYAMSSARVIGTCFAIGEAVGTAAAKALHDGVSVQDVNVQELQQELRKAGVPL